MDITRESILGVGMAGSMVGLKWLRPNTPYTYAIEELEKSRSN